MPNELPLPPELRHLIEKRESDRRAGERRTGQEQCKEHVPEKLASEPENAAEPENQRTGSERRQADERREALRRTAE